MMIKSNIDEFFLTTTLIRKHNLSLRMKLIIFNLQITVW